jgi:Xaa-Pro aminopeptidase
MSLDDYRHLILPLREQSEIKNKRLRQRLETVIPQIMEREGFDVWLIVCREYNEDPVIMSLLPAPAMSARRRTILLFHRTAAKVERLCIDRYGHGDFYEGAWKPEQEEQWACLARLIKERNPQKIGLNLSQTFAFGDGLSYTEAEALDKALGEYASRCSSAERLAVGWLETRIADEIMAYPQLVEMGHALIAEAFSTKVIHVGITTSDDVVWWLRQRITEMGLQAWFQPSCEIQAVGQTFENETPRNVIMQGDLLWIDVGFIYLGLATDQQQHAYVLKAGETDAPEGLKAALADANALQDIHMREMQVGRTGNQVLAAALEAAKAQGINPQIYSHPLGYHGHAAGPTIGLWDSQGGVEGRGDYPIFDNTVYSIELNIRKAIPEWGGQEVRIALEEDAVMQGGKIRWLHHRQEKFHLIG